MISLVFGKLRRYSSALNKSEEKVPVEKELAEPADFRKPEIVSFQDEGNVFRRRHRRFEVLRPSLWSRHQLRRREQQQQQPRDQ